MKTYLQPDEVNVKSNLKMTKLYPEHYGLYIKYNLYEINYLLIIKI